MFRVMRTVKDTISLEDIVFYSTQGQLEVLPELSEMHGSAAYSPEPHTPLAHHFTLTHVYSPFCRSSGFRPIFYREHGSGYSTNEFGQAGIQLESSSILLRLCHSCSRPLFQKKSTRVVQYTQSVTGRESGLRSVTARDGSSPFVSSCDT